MRISAAYTRKTNRRRKREITRIKFIGLRGHRRFPFAVIALLLVPGALLFLFSLFSLISMDIEDANPAVNSRPGATDSERPTGRRRSLRYLRGTIGKQKHFDAFADENIGEIID